jgi:hypothetical protein
MSRYFSSSARAFLNFIWKGTDPVGKYEDLLKEKLAKNPKLAQADTIEIAQVSPNSTRDPTLTRA